MIKVEKTTLIEMNVQFTEIFDGATIEEAIGNFVEILEEATRSGQIPEKAAPVDNLKELGKMFKR